jgi:hypothetical protein
MQIITRNVERDLQELFTERNELIAKIDELRKEIEILKNNTKRQP